MSVTPEQILAIAALVVSGTQAFKRIFPGDIDDLGPLLSVVFSMIASVAWVYQYRPDALTTAWFDILVLIASVYAAATGGYTVARQVTNVGGRSMRKLRAVRDESREGAA